MVCRYGEWLPFHNTTASEEASFCELRMDGRITDVRVTASPLLTPLSLSLSLSLRTFPLLSTILQRQETEVV